MPASRSRIRHGRAALVALPVVGLALGAALLARSGEDNLPIVEYRPGAGVPRLALTGAVVQNLGRVTSFDTHGDRLYLLDGLQHVVVILQRDGDGTWRRVGEFGRRGEGPGEFVGPSSIAVSEDGNEVAVGDGSRLHFFGSSGGFIRASTIAATCPSIRPILVAGANGYYLIDTCLRGRQGDRMVWLLHHTVDGSRYRKLAEDVQWTRDGSFGSALAVGTLNVMDGRVVFGTGASPCYQAVSWSEGKLVTEKHCHTVSTLFAAPPPPGHAERMQVHRARRPAYSAVFEWPPHLPVYGALASSPSGDLLFRSISTDSVVLRLSGDERDLMVMPADGMRGCRRGGCLWERPTLEGAEIVLVTAEHIAAIASGLAVREAGQ